MSACSTPGCGKTLGRRNTSGQCRSCVARRVNACPEMAQRRIEGIRRKFAEDPAHRAKMAKVARANGRKGFAIPGRYEALVEHGKRQYAAVLSRPDVRAKTIEAVRASQSKRLQTIMGWLPDRYRGLYLKLTRAGPGKRIKAAEARALIEKKIADDNAIRSGELSDALFFLRRLGPVTKLDDGTYRYGSAVLSPGELVQRAKVKGWKSPSNDQMPERKSA